MIVGFRDRAKYRALLYLLIVVVIVIVNVFLISANVQKYIFFIIKNDRYKKVSQSFIESVTDITKCDEKLLRSVIGSKKCENYYQMRRNKVNEKVKVLQAVHLH